MNKIVNFTLCIFASALLFACKDDEPMMDEPTNKPEPEIELMDLSKDLLHGRMIYRINLNNPLDGDYLLDTREPIDIVPLENPNLDTAGFPLFVEDTPEGQVLGTMAPNGYNGERVMFTARAVGRETGEVRHVLVMIDDDFSAENPSVDGVPHSSRIYDAYDTYIGKGTKCFGEVGNNGHNIMMFSEADYDNKEMFSKGGVGSVSMDEINEHSFEEMSKKWALNVGISGSYSGWTGSLGFGIEKESRQSKDYEYYMCYLKVARHEIRLNTNEIARMTTRNEKDASAFLGRVTTAFIEDALHMQSQENGFNWFFDQWGTDVITQGTLGGYSTFIYSREETAQQTHIGVDIKAYVSHKKDVEKDPTMGQWYNIYKQYSNSDDFKTSVGISYADDKYFSSSQVKCNYWAKGGSATDGSSANDWMKAFNEDGHEDQWAMISYRTSFETNDNNKEIWLLYDVTKMATNVVAATETCFEATGEMSLADQLLIENAYKQIKVYERHREAYIQSNLITEKERSRLVLCDVKMVNYDARRKPKEPQPFVAADPRNPDKMRTYYPMICNNNFDIRRGAKGMRGKPIDTNDDVFIASGHTTSHYWFYALAHEDDCEGLTDIRFLTEDEARTDYPYHVRHGDHARHGLSGLLAKKRYVYLKYWSPNIDKDRNKKITAFGLWDSHSDYNKKEKAKRIVSSTGIVEWTPNMDEDEARKVEAFWNDPSIQVLKSANQFYQGGGVMPHKLYPVYTTKTLPEDELKSVKKSVITW